MEWPEEFPNDQAFVELLVPAISSELDFEQLINDTKEKLKLNASSIEQHLLELQAKMGDSRTGDRPPSPTECQQWFNIKMLNNLRPMSAGHQEVMSFFTCLQNYLRSKDEGREDATLHLLVNLSSESGICFPCTPSLSTPFSHHQLLASPFALIHTIKDDSSTEIQVAWDDIRLQLRCYLLERLSTESGAISALSNTQRVHCLQQLCFLYPECEVRTHYQGLRGQAMLALLHSAMCSCRPGISGFDRVTIAFRSVIPTLIRALKEDLHVLPRVFEPHIILGFLNASYLRPMAGELSSLMERECETALRDNTVLSSRIKRYSSKSRATVAPMEAPVKSRSFSLTSHQLKALTQLACTLLAYENNVKEIVTNMTFINCMGDTPSVKGILKKTKEESDITELGKTSTAQTPHTSEVLEFDWRSAFSGLAPHMAHCVKVVLDDVCTKSLQQEESLHSSAHYTLLLENISGHNDCKINCIEDNFDNYSERDTPTMVAQFCFSVVTEMDALLPLAAACRDSSLLEVRSSFVESCSQAVLAMLVRVEQRALEVPSSLPLKNLPALLATSIYVQQRLEHYHARLKDSTSNLAKVHLSLLPVQKYQQTIEALKEQLSSYCVQVCTTCVLQDAESHHWADLKPFYEGERCSFSVQMWFYFLCGLRSDLWAVLPPRLAKELLGQVLSETLQVLVQRYARAQPSFKRHVQIRYDITAVLLFVEQLMWSVSESPESMLQRNLSSAITIISGGSDWPYQIHSLCEQLLTVLVIATAPLPLLHRIFMDGHAHETPQQLEGPVVHWLNALKPEVFTEQAVQDGLMGQEASACQLRLLTSDPGSNPRLLLQMLLHRDCHLPRMVLENSHFCQESQLNISSLDRKARDAFIIALFNIFTCLNDIPDALTLVLQPYLESVHVWEHLYTMAETTQEVPIVVDLIRVIVTKSTDTLLTHLVTMVTDWQAPEGARDIPKSILAKLPKSWNYTPMEAHGSVAASSKTVISLLIQAVSFIFTHLPLVVASLPLPIRYLFQVAEKHLSQHDRHLRSMGLLLWSLFNCLIHSLGHPCTLEEISGLALNCQAKDRLVLLAECLQASMGIQQKVKGVPKATVHKVLQALEEKRPKWMNMQLQKARKLCINSGLGAAAELTEQKMGLMLLEVCHKAGGSDYLRHIHHIIQGNEELLMSRLSGDTDLPFDSPCLVSFDVNNCVPATKFNPLDQFDRIGKKKLDQGTLVEWTWEWAKLLQSYRNMCQVTLKSLLANRWEMQDGAELEDDEKMMAEELQRAYFVCHCDAGLQESREADETTAERTQGGQQASDKTAAQ
ncbi:uncharacterized protein KIAA0825 homolog isoform X1 [Corythoichthys intestinalis]|uniref:uncharacterized protein KIAA0825 homolog isoform X1 n=1 Tax=Corythoichthys intestinalis TaxID=161448 RepID=UPI0025A625B7|nr:uncharacterized protein KIAA0825 homolog isoform X1 [Corythoichthys intestinalis]XP_057686986.1 uncharacterized protein KIAA0825 homolog isoform X1 [Corythoichthys intestinalis]